MSVPAKDLPARVEKDSMGNVNIPAGALYGAQTQRAVEIFPVSGHAMPGPFVQALGLIKFAAAQVNQDLGKMDAKIGDLIRQAAREVYDGKLNAQFPIDVFQTGSATSS
ncbi:MAG TPA: lyase family protein, partial [Planctomycetota bacterium]|nr:lyase family protein [Planctomycetota bacterium]